MWLFAQKGFLSIVEHKDNKDLLLVRGRIKGDIEKHFPDAKVERTDAFDYLYRAAIPRNEVAAVMASVVNNIDYHSYKGSLEDKQRRMSWYLDVWSTMFDMQHVYEDEGEPKDGKEKERASGRILSSS